jgi:hypothetical protein
MRPGGDDGLDREAASRWEQVAALALSGVVAALHALRLLSAGGLWRDEAGAARLATLPTFREVYGLFPHEAFPPLFPATLRAWSFLVGESDPALRAFGLAVGLSILLVLWWNARAARTVPLLSLALLGLDLPFLVYGDGVRGYGLGCALLLLTYGLLARALAAPRVSPALAGGTAAAAVASVQVVLGNAALLCALCLAAGAVAAWRRRWGRAGWIVGCGALAALSLLPYAGPLARAAQQWNPIVVYPLRLSRLGHAFTATLGPPVARGVWLLLLAVGLGSFAWVWRRRAERGAPLLASPRVQPAPSPGGGISADGALFAALVLPGSLVAAGIFLKTLSYTPRPWYFLPLLALLGSASDALFAALVRARGRPFATLRAAAVLLVAGAQVAPLAAYATLRQTNVDRVAERVARSATRDDLVVVDSWYYGVSFSRYYAGAAPWRTLPDLPDHRVHRYDLLRSKLAARQPIADVLAAVALTLRSGHRVWLVGTEWPRPGAAVPVLPPAPASPYGWHDWPYTTSWSRQLGSFLRSHAARAADLSLPLEEPVSAFEDLPLSVAEGWRGSP